MMTLHEANKIAKVVGNSDNLLYVTCFLERILHDLNKEFPTFVWELNSRYDFATNNRIIVTNRVIVTEILKPLE